jgi:hypothetical protein
MTGVVVVDTNLTVLLVVGSASKEYIAMHKCLQHYYSVDDFELLWILIAEFSEIDLLPHILADVSSLARQIKNPARAKVQNALRKLTTTATELQIQSASGAQRAEFDELGLTDAVILHFCDMSVNGLNPTLITCDTDLANNAHSLGYSVIDYKREYQSG